MLLRIVLRHLLRHVVIAVRSIWYNCAQLCSRTINWRSWAPEDACNYTAVTGHTLAKLSWSSKKAATSRSAASPTRTVGLRPGCPSSLPTKPCGIATACNMRICNQARMQSRAACRHRAQVHACIVGMPINSTAWPSDATRGATPLGCWAPGAPRRRASRWRHERPPLSEKSRCRPARSPRRPAPGST